MTFANLVHLVVPFAPHWEKIGTMLKLKDKVEELKKTSFNDSVKMTIILDNWSVYGDELSWLNLLEEMEDDEELLPLVADIRKYLIEKVHTSTQPICIGAIIYCVDAPVLSSIFLQIKELHVKAPGPVATKD